MIEYPPDILLHENVLGFPHEKMAHLLGQFLVNTAGCSAISKNIYVSFVGHVFKLLGCERLDPKQFGFPIERPRKYLILAMAIVCLSWFKSKPQCEVYIMGT